MLSGSRNVMAGTAHVERIEGRSKRNKVVVVAAVAAAFGVRERRHNYSIQPNVVHDQLA